MPDINKVLEKLSPEKRALLEKKLKQNSQNYNAFPLSFAQRRLWFLDQLQPGNLAYNIPVALKISGKFDTNILEKSIHGIVDRHEILRGNIVVVNDNPVLVINKNYKLKINKQDLSALNNYEQKSKLDNILISNSNYYFHLDKDPLFQVHVLKLAEDKHVLQIVMHHIITDGWSVGNFIQEFSISYSSLLENKNPDLPSLPIQYADYAKWQSNWAKSDDYKRKMDYWLNEFNSIPEALELPLDFARPTQRQYDGAVISKSLEDSSLAKKFCHVRNISLFNLALAVLKILLHKYSGNTDICIGSPIANRSNDQIKNLIGFFVNTLAIRSTIDPLESFERFLSKVKDKIFNAFDHQEIPFEDLIERISPERNMGQTPLFQVMFTFQNIKKGGFAINELDIEPYEIQSHKTKFDLSISLNEENEKLDIILEYDKEIYSSESIERMMNSFEQIFSSVINNPNTLIKDLEYISIEDLKIIENINSNEHIYQPLNNIIQLYYNKLQDNLGYDAVIYEDTKIDYRELEVRSNQLANYLIRRGVKLDSIVSILLNRSIESIISILAIWKAGAAYLPLKTDFPKDRISNILSDSNSTHIILNAEQRSLIEYSEIEIIEYNTEIENIEKESDDPIQTESKPSNLAYVIYTSGSTGSPKGVMINHSTLINLALGLKEKIYKDINTNLKVSLNAPFIFDASVQQIVQICFGHTLQIFPEDIRLDPEKLISFIRSNRIDVFDCVPTQLQALEEVGYFDKDNWIPQICLPGGEAISKSLWDAIKSESRSSFFNMYGPTECTVDSTICDIKTTIGNPTIGKPINNVTHYILDEHLNHVPVGVAGQLYIGGDCLSRGYLNNPQLTASRFIPDPFSLNDGKRIYATGDKVKFRADGNIEYLSRVDDQIKLRGFRIELGEIDSVIAELSIINQAVSILHSPQNGEKRIVSFITLNEKAEDYENIIKTELAKKLPTYMVPSSFIELEKIPTLPNGKINKRALPVDGIQLSRKNIIPPETEIQKKLCEIFKTVLSIDHEISIKDNFFSLGGHSLLATKCIAQIRKVFEIDVPLALLFEYPDIEKIANAIEELKDGSKTSSVQKIERAKNKSNIHLSYAQQRLWFLDKIQPASSFYNIPFALRLKGELNIDYLSKSIKNVVNRHEILRTTFSSEEGKPVQIVHDKLEIEIFVNDLREIDSSQRESKAIEFCNEQIKIGFSLTDLPLFSVSCVILSDNEFILVSSIHHIISDGWSSNLLMSEISMFYTSYLNGTSPKLPELEIQYSDYSIWQRKWLVDTELNKRVEFWKQYLNGVPTILDLPIDKKRPEVQTYNGAVVEFNISNKYGKLIGAINRETGTTPFMFFISVFGILLSKLSNQEDILIGSPVANREAIEVQRLIGLFVNTIPIKISPLNQMSFIELLHETKNNSVKAFANKELPFEKIIDSVDLERSPAYSPLFQVMFIYNALEKSKKIMGGIESEPFQFQSVTSKFDLSLTAQEKLDNSYSLAIEYNTDLFNESSISKYIKYFKTILDRVTRNKSEPIKECALLNNSEQQQLVESINSVDLMSTCSYNVPSDFVKVARNVRNEVAIEYEGTSYTFGDLDNDSTRLANLLISKGIRVEDIVAISLPRSYELIVALIGVLKSGAAYLPIDPTLPKDRISYILNDAHVKSIITNDSLSNLINIGDGNTILLEWDKDILSEYNTVIPSVAIDELNICYVIYTSGSTGNPKGTLITHLGFKNYIDWTHHKYPFNQEIGSLVHSTISFDATVTSIFPSLLKGKKIILMKESKEIDELSDIISKNSKLSFLKITPAHLDLLSQLIPAGKAKEVADAMIIGGENLTSNQIEFWQKNSPETSLLNEYGPTEAVVGCVVFDAKEYTNAGSIPIGKVIPNVSIYILGKNLEQIPKGTIGELYIGGISLARGYLNKADLTAERFIPNPFSTSDGERIYRTGDLVKILPNNDLIFIDRIDDQVKVRGYRIELGEIDSYINKFPAIKDAVTIVREVSPNRKNIVTYFTNKPDTEFDKNQLKAYLGEKLPEYMVPNIFVKLNSIPLTANGKVNRNALPAPDSENTDVAKKYEPPKTENEKILVQAIEAVLGVTKVGIHDNFFELGGDSIVGIQVISKASQAGISITPVQLFQYQTVHKLAAVAKGSLVNNAEQGSIVGEFDFIPIQKMFLDSEIENKNHWNQCLLFTVDKLLNEDVLVKTVKKITEHHDMLRVSTNKEFTKQILDDQFDERTFEIVELNEDYENISEIVELKSAEYQASLNIIDGPIFKIVYFKSDQNKGWLLFVFHHFIIDGVSWRILLEDFQTTYHSLESNLEVSLPRKTNSFKEWSSVLQIYTDTKITENELKYWISKIDEYELNLPIENPEGLNSEESSKIISARLEEIQTKKLLTEVHKKYNTKIDDILLTALILSFSKLTSKRSVFVNLEGHGRNQIEDNIDLSRTIGWFTTMYPLNLNLKKSISIGESVKTIKEQIRLTPNEGIGFGLLRYLNEDEEIRNRLSIFDNIGITFNYLGQFDNVLDQKSLFKPANENKGFERANKNSRISLIDISGSIFNNQLSMNFMYSKNIFNDTTMQSWLDSYMQSLTELITHCTDDSKKTFTSSDFNLSGLNDKKLNKVLSKLKKK